MSNWESFVIRGGCYFYYNYTNRASCRFKDMSWLCSSFVGIRICIGVKHE